MRLAILGVGYISVITGFMSRHHAALKIILRMSIWIVVAWFVLDLLRTLRNLDWHQVFDAIVSLSFAQLALLVVLSAIRVLLNSVPLALLVPRLGVPKAVINDLVGDLVAVATPPPADIVARGALFKSWGIPVSTGIAGLVMNSILYYVVRLVAPLFGAAILLIFIDDDSPVGFSAIAVGIVGIALVALLTVFFSNPSITERPLRWLSERAHKLSSRVPPADVIAEKVSSFQRSIASRWLKYWPHASLAFAGMLIAESSVLIFSLRFSGVPSIAVPNLIIVGCFLSLYILKALPMQGLGVLDAAVIAMILETCPLAASAELVAGLIVWRVCVQLLPFVFGVVPVIVLKKSIWETPA